VAYHSVRISCRSHVKNHLLLHLCQSIVRSLDHPRVELWIIPESGREFHVAHHSIHVGIYSLHDFVNLLVCEGQADQSHGFAELVRSDVAAAVVVKLSKDRVERLS